MSTHTLTDPEMVFLKAMMEVLDRQPAEIAEAAWHGLTEARLGATLDLVDFNTLRDYCLIQRWIVGAPHPVSLRPRWVLSQAGKIALQQL